MKKSDTEQDTSVLEEKIVPERQTDEELDKELQQIEEENRREEQYYEERRRERHERNLKRKKRQIRNRNLALIITALVILGGVGYYFRDQLGLQDKAEMLVAKAKEVIPEIAHRVRRIRVRQMANQRQKERQLEKHRRQMQIALTIPKIRKMMEAIPVKLGRRETVPGNHPIPRTSRNRRLPRPLLRM